MVAYLGGHFYNHQWRHSEKLLVHSCPKNRAKLDCICFRPTKHTKFYMTNKQHCRSPQEPWQLQSQSAIPCFLDTFVCGMVQGQGASKCSKARTVKSGLCFPCANSVTAEEECCNIPRQCKCTT